MHFYSLNEGRRPAITSGLLKLPPVTWGISGDGQHGVYWPPGLSKLTHEACKSPPAQKDVVFYYQASVASGCQLCSRSKARGCLHCRSGSKGPRMSYPPNQPAWMRSVPHAVSGQLQSICSLLVFCCPWRLTFGGSATALGDAVHVFNACMYLWLQHVTTCHCQALYRRRHSNAFPHTRCT